MTRLLYAAVILAIVLLHAATGHAMMPGRESIASPDSTYVVSASAHGDDGESRGYLVGIIVDGYTYDSYKATAASVRTITVPRGSDVIVEVIVRYEDEAATCALIERTETLGIASVQLGGATCRTR